MSRNKYCCDCNMLHEDVVKSVKSNMLSVEDFSQISRYFKALGDSTRIRIIWALYNSEMCVCDLSNLLNMSISSISHQLRELKINKLIKSRRKGKSIYYSLMDEHIKNFVKNALEHISEAKNEG